jgi:hypothetical protein
MNPKKKKNPSGVDPLFKISLYLPIHTYVCVCVHFYVLFVLGKLMKNLFIYVSNYFSNPFLMQEFAGKDEVPCCHSFSLQIQFKPFFFQWD